MSFLNNFLQNKLVKNSFILISGNILAGFLGYLFHLLISRKLSIQDYGEVQALTSLLNILAVPTGALYFFIIKYASDFFAKDDAMANYKFYKWLNTNIILLILGLTTIFVITSPLIKSYLHLQNYSNLFIIWLVVILGLLVVIQRGILTGWQDFKNLNRNNIFSAIIKLIIGVSLVFIFTSDTSALLGFGAGALFSYFFLKIVVNKINQNIKKQLTAAKNDNHFFDKQKVINEVKKYILPILLFSFLITMLNSFDMLMVKNIADENLAGIYGAFNILSKIIFWASSSVVMVILPMACAENSKQKTLNNKIIFYANGLIFMICLSGLLIYLLLPQLVINLLFGSRYLPMANMLWAFALMALALSLLTLEANLAYARYDFKISYILLATLILEIISVYFFSQSLLSIALSITIVQFTGYVLSLLYNLKSIKRLQIIQNKELALFN